MAIDPVALASEINTDPVSIGYAAIVATKSDQAVADALNLVRQAVGFKIAREPVPVSVLFSNIAAAEFLALTQLKVTQLNAVLSAGTIDLNDASTQNILIGIFGNGSVTQTNITALLNRQGSRAEKLFGRGAVVTANDISKALRNQ